MLLNWQQTKAVYQLSANLATAEVHDITEIMNVKKCIIMETGM